MYYYLIKHKLSEHIVFESGCIFRTKNAALNYANIMFKLLTCNDLIHEIVIKKI